MLGYVSLCGCDLFSGMNIGLAIATPQSAAFFNKFFINNSVNNCYSHLSCLSLPARCDHQ